MRANRILVEDIIELTPMQHGLLFHSVSAPDDATYVLQGVMSVRGPVDVVLLKQACGDVVGAHPALRASFHWQELDQPLQVVQPVVDVPVLEADWSGLNQDDERLRSYLVADRQRTFDPTVAPLIRMHLIRLGRDQFSFIWSCHHIVVDGWSLSLVIQELWRRYQAMACGETVPAQSDTRPYRDYVMWLRGRDAAADEAYWRRTLGGFTAPTPLPGGATTAGPSSGVRRWRGRTWPVEATERLQAVAHRHRLTLSALVHGAWALVLSRHSGNNDVVFGTVTSGRPPALSGVERMVGLFANTVTVRARVPPDVRADAWLQQLQAALVEAREHEHCPLGTVHKWSDVPRDLPLFDSLLVFANYPLTRMATAAATVEAQALTIGQMHVIQAGHHPLCLVAQCDPGLCLEFHYDGARFETAAIDALLNQCEVALNEMAAAPTRPVGALQLVTAAEREAAATAWNATSTQGARSLLHELVEAQASRAPDAVAVDVAGRQLTYATLNGRANQLARYLRANGVGAEVRVGLCTERSLELVIGVVAILKAGGAYAPLDPESPRERLASVLSHARPAMLLTQAALRARIPDSDASVFCLDADWSSIEAHSAANLDCVATPDNLAYIAYTSGSTGTPKGILLAHRGLTNVVLASTREFELGAADRLLGVFASTFDGMMWQVAAALAAGARLVLPPIVPSGSELLLTLEESAITVLALPVSVLASVPAAALPHLRLIATAGEACTRERVNQWASSRRFVNCYGPAETTICSTLAGCRAGTGPVPIGRPIANTHTYVVDGAGQLAPVGMAGELWIGGVGVARGYLRHATLTAERFVPDAWSGAAGARVYRTGDVVRRDGAGAMTFVGRVDHQVKVRGFRVELGEVEAVLAAHPGVRETVVVATAAEGGARLVAYVVPVTDAEPTTTALRAHVAARLPDYMVPAACVLLARLPLTPHGKVDRAALPTPEGHRPALAVGYVAPRTETERTLAAIWAQVLRVSPVGVTDNFFDLGGDSILAIQIVARAQEAGLVLATRHLFAQQTIAELTTVVGTHPPIAIEQGPIGGTVPLTPIQRWFFTQDLASPNQFTQAQWITAAEPLAAGVLAAALAAVVRHHDALRLQFRRTTDGWMQAHGAAPATVPVDVKDLGAVPEAEHGAVRAATAAALQGGLDLDAGVLLRAALCTGGTRAAAEILLVVHHLVVDVVSWPILVADLETAYRQLAAGARATLPAKTSAFQTWATRLQAYARTRAIAAEGASWAAMDARPAPALPVDHDTGPNVMGTSRTVTVALEAAETTALIQTVPHASHTQVADVLLTALAQAMTAWTGGRRARVALEGHGREPLFADVDVSRTVGWFTTLYPVVLELPAGDEPGAALRAVKEQMRHVPHHGLGYGVWRYLTGSPPPYAAPAADVAFNYLGRVTRTPGAAGLLTIVPGPLGGERHPAQTRPGLLEITAAVSEGRLVVVWAYSANRHTEATIAAVAERFVRGLQALIAHCCTVQTGRWTAADVGDVPLLNDGELDLLLSVGEERASVAG